jgi:hypothetical protein
MMTTRLKRWLPLVLNNCLKALFEGRKACTDLALRYVNIRLNVLPEHRRDFLPYSSDATLPRLRLLHTRKSGRAGRRKNKRASRQGISSSFAWPVISFGSRNSKQSYSPTTFTSLPGPFRWPLSFCGASMVTCPAWLDKAIVW